MKIGEVAAASGCHLETVRYYERIGLLPKPRRTDSGYRSYSDDDVRRLRFITRGRELGFSLEEIRSLLRLSDEPDLSCAEVDQIARHHLTEIEQRVVELKRMAKELTQTISTCRGGERAACTILDALHAPQAETSRRRRAAAVH